jgi:lipopolysaccharide transport system permease protein
MAGGIAAVSLGLGSLYATILKVELREFLPFLVIGLTVWTMIQVTLSEACASFTTAGAMIKNTPLPVGIHVFRNVSRNIILLAHNAVVVAAVLLVLQRPMGPEALLAIPGLLLLIINVTWMSYVVSLAATRFRDVGQIIIYLLQFAMFVTPIFWLPGMAGDRHFAVRGNPLYHMIEVVRGPLMGAAPSAENWQFCIGLAVIGGAVTWLLQWRLAKRVVYWV